MPSNATSTAWIDPHLQEGRQGEDDAAQTANVTEDKRNENLKPEPLQRVDAWLAPFRRFWSAHVDALERHLDRMGSDQSTPTPTKKKTKEKTTRPKPRT